MPEGHSVRRHADEVRRRFAGLPVAASSPQGRFAAGAALLDGRPVSSTDAHGKHLLVGFGERVLHVHLGLYGGWTFGEGDPPEVRGQVRLRLTGPGPGGEGAWADLRAATACEVLAAHEVAALHGRLGADPLRADADPDAAYAVVSRSRTPLGALLMRQDVVAGVGNVYRAEALFRAGIDPHRPGRDVGASQWAALWDDLVLLLRAGVRSGRIVTTEREDRDRRTGPARREDAHYVYKRTGLPCRRCATPVVAEPFVARTLYRCPTCQAA